MLPVPSFVGKRPECRAGEKRAAESRYGLGGFGAPTLHPPHVDGHPPGW